MIATAERFNFFEQVWVPVWLVLIGCCFVGAVVWYLSQGNRDDVGMEALQTAFLGPLFAYFWPVFLVLGLVFGLCWSLRRMRLRIHPRLKIPLTDLRHDAERLDEGPG